MEMTFLDLTANVKCQRDESRFRGLLGITVNNPLCVRNAARKWHVLVDQQLKNVKKVVTKINSAVKHLVDVVLETEWFVGLKTVGEGCINNVTGFIKLVLARLGIPLDALNGDIVATAVAGDRQTVGVGVGLNSRDLCRCASNQHGAHRNYSGERKLHLDLLLEFFFPLWIL